MGRPTRVVDALVLRLVDFGDADRIVTLLTPDDGRIAGIARSARKSQKRFAGALQSAQHVRVELCEGRGELVTILRVELVDAHAGLLTDLARLRLAGSALALVRELVPERRPEPEAFAATVRYLAAQSSQPASEGLKLAFVVRLLSTLGLAPELSVCVSCGKPAPPGRAALFDPRKGGLVCRECGGGPYLFSGATLEALREAEASDGVVLEDGCVRECEHAIDAFVRLHSPSPQLRS